jgi:hypothetical protein
MNNGGAGGLVVMVIQLAIFAAIIAGIWKAFVKAGEPGWAAIVPIYNTITMAKIAGRDWWWGLLPIIPCVGIVVMIMMSMDIAKNFGKSSGFGIGLALLGPIFWPMLGFGDAQYSGTKKA